MNHTTNCRINEIFVTILGGDFTQSTKSNDPGPQSLKLSANMRNSCLPKMLCEIAAKPRTVLSDKEKTLLDLLTWVEIGINFAFIFFVQSTIHQSKHKHGLHTEIIQFINAMQQQQTKMPRLQFSCSDLHLIRSELLNGKIKKNTKFHNS